MRDFLKQCLEELEDLTGNRQLFYLKSDPEGEKRIKVCIMGMVMACRDYPFIPEESQMKIIRDQMVKDQNYDALNSRTIHKWLQGASNAFRTHSQFSEEDLMTRDKDGNLVPPAPPEVADRFIKEFQASLAQIGTQLPTVADIEKGLKEVKTKETGRQKFVIEGIEIWATSEDEAKKAYNATFI